MDYTPGVVPDDPKMLPDFLRREFQKMQQIFAGKQALLRLDKTDVSPPKPRDGDVRYADGSNWNPGFGIGPYQRQGGSWVPFGMSFTVAGTYTPTLTNVTNVTASTAYECQYMRVGSVVTVSGKVDVDPNLAVTDTQIGISLPVASNLGAVEDCSGTAACPAIAGQSAAILGDATNNRATMQWKASDVTNQAMHFSFSYQII